MTRQNVTDGVREIMTKPCPTCEGEGVVKSEETIGIEAERKLREIVKAAGGDGPEAYLVRLNPRVTAHFTADGARELHALEQETGRFFHFEGSEGLPLDHFAITLEGTREQVMERSVPFTDGDEVHVEIVEPHMYNADDAVAKVDGYLISVVNGGAFVGEKKLVRIEDAGRTGAVAVLVGKDAELAAEAAEERAKDRARAEQRAKRSAAAKRGAAKRKARQAETATSDEPVPATDAEAAEAVEALATREVTAAGTGPAAVADAEGEGPEAAGETAAKPKRRRRRKSGGDGDGDGAKGDGAKAAAEDGGDNGKRATRGRSRRRAKAADPDSDGAAPAETPAAEASPDADQADDDALSSRPRRRGRRGGRRRSRAKADNDRAEVSEASD
jgi:ribonuclease G